MVLDQQKLDWLLEGDVSVQFQVHRDLLKNKRPDLQNRIRHEGWGALFLSKRLPNGHWGNKFYHPKWTSSHYTLLDLKNLCIPNDIPEINETISLILENEKGIDGGINPATSTRFSDLCINGMFLNYASYFKTDSRYLHPVVDFILSQKMPDGGFNCSYNRSGARHSSMHSTISALEGFTEYIKNGYKYRVLEVEDAKQSSIEFLLMHQLYLSDRTGKVINDKFLKFPYPARWYYDILRALDYFQYEGIGWDERMAPAIDILLKKRNKDLTWNMQAKHPGQIHFEMEKAGKPSRWNTLRALRVLKHFKIE